MAIIKPFKGIRPPQNLVEQVASRPYDVLNSEEARAEAEGNEKSLYHIIKPEIDFPVGMDEHDERVYAKAAENFQLFQDKGWLVQDSKAKSKVVILLTDGVNNRGAIAPITAAELAKTFGIRVYTIGVGTLGEAPYPVQTPFGMQLQRMPVEIDEDILTQIADMTGGKYFRATDNKKLEQIYQEIDQLEKSKVEVKHFSRKNEQYFYFALIGALLLIVEALGRYTLLRKIP